MALGMASPYLVIGANPRLVKLLPKPGLWMESFKHLMGFVLLGTVVFVLSYLSWTDVLPTVALLFGLWAACWWIGQTSSTAELPAKLRSWAGAGLFATLVGLIAFGWLRPVMEERFLATIDRINSEKQSTMTAVSNGNPDAPDQKLAWQPYTTNRLRQLTAEGKTVMVDFTADWCLLCKTLEKTVLNTDDVRSAVEKNGIVTLSADWTDRNEEITQMLHLLGSAQVPVLAIFPAGRANEPVILRGGYTKSQLLGKLNQASSISSNALAPEKSRSAQRTPTNPKVATDLK
jgi:thiol:disulfide interchange protein